VELASLAAGIDARRQSLEQGFVEASLDDLPAERQSLYNLQRNSKVFIKNLS